MRTDCSHDRIMEQIPVCLDGTIIDSSTILVTTEYVLLWLCCGMIGGCAWWLI